MVVKRHVYFVGIVQIRLDIVDKGRAGHVGHRAHLNLTPGLPPVSRHLYNAIVGARVE